MDFEQQNNIYLKVIENLNYLNNLLYYNNKTVDPIKFTEYLNKKNFNLQTNDMNIYLSSLLIFIFSLDERSINLDKKNINQLLVINFVNTILQELNIKQIKIEVI